MDEIHVGLVDSCLWEGWGRCCLAHDRLDRGGSWQWCVSSLSGKRGGRGIGDEGGMGDNGSTVNNKKLDRSTSITEGRIKYLGSSGACGGGGINGVSFDCSVI